MSIHTTLLYYGAAMFIAKSITNYGEVQLGYLLVSSAVSLTTRTCKFIYNKLTTTKSIDDQPRYVYTKPLQDDDEYEYVSQS